MLLTGTWINCDSSVWGTWRIPNIYLTQAAHGVTFSRALSVRCCCVKLNSLYYHIGISHKHKKKSSDILQIGLININDVMMPFMSFMNQYPLLLQTLGLGLPAEFLIMSAVFRRWRWNLKYPHSHASNTFHFQCLPKGSTLCKHTFKGQHTHSDGDNVYHWKSGNVWQRRANVKMTTQRPELAPEGLFGSKWIIPVMQYYFILNSLNFSRWKSKFEMILLACYSVLCVSLFLR